jgi:crossover junction endodeoxyribonuclease RusA
MLFEFLIPQRPRSVQAKKQNDWKSFVNAEAAKKWNESPCTLNDLELTLVYLFESDPVDIDNIIKPIQDSLKGLVYVDDGQVADVAAHRRHIYGDFDITRCSTELIRAIDLQQDCVYVRVQNSSNLEEYL